MQITTIPIFKQWVPEWLAKTVIYAVLMTSLFSFALYYNNPESITGYYGIEPADVQYSVVLMYAAVVAYLALDYRIVKYLTSRRYLLIGLALNAITYFICFYTKNWGVFMISRFIQGIACALLCSIVLNLTFPRLHSTRSRVIGYTIFYAGLQISIPICAIYCTIVLHFYNFNWLFYGLNILLLPVVILVILTMNSGGRFQKKLPLYQVDWFGFIFYAAFCLILGFILVYGQQLNWYDSQLITSLTLLNIILLISFIIRENRIKRPLINLRLFKTRNFIIGLFLLFAFYVFKGTTGLTYGYLEAILGVNPLNIVPIWSANLVGTLLSSIITARFVLQGKSLFKLITIGFVILALYYIYMLLFVSTVGETADFILPMFIYGLATGALFVPTVLFTASTLSPKIAFNASFIGIFARFTGFCASISINNYTQLYTKAVVRDKIQTYINTINPQLQETLNGIQSAYINSGSDSYTAKTAANNYFNNMINSQILARSIRDYYDIMLIGLVILILILIILPSLKNGVIKLRKVALPLLINKNR